MAKTPTPAQLAARERFAAMARAGAFKRKTGGAKKVKANPAPRELRNRWGVVIKRGNWVQGRTARGDIVEGIVAKVERTGDFARAYGPRVILHNGTSLGIDDVTQTLGPMTFDPSGIVRQNPLTRVKVKSPSMATGAPPSKRLTKRRKATAKAPQGYYANPVSAAMPWGVFRGEVQIAAFRSEAKAKEYGQAYADAHRMPVGIKRIK